MFAIPGVTLKGRYAASAESLPSWPELGEIRRMLLRQATGVFILKVFGAGLTFLVSIALARAMGVASFGKYSLVMSVVNILSAVAAFGLPMMVVRQVAVYRGSEQWGALKGTILTAHWWPPLISALLSIVTLIAQPWLPASLRGGSIWLGMLLVPLLALNQVRASILRGLRWVVLADTPELIFRPLVVLICLGIAASYSNALLDEYSALSFQLIAVAAAFFFGLLFMWGRLPDQVHQVRTTGDRKELLVGGITFLGVALVSLLEGQAALLLLGFLSGTRDAGIYQAASQLVALLVFGLLAVNTTLQPRLAAAWAQDDKLLAQHLITYSARFGLVMAVLMGLGLMVFSERLMVLYGPTFVGGATALRILVFGQLVNAASGPCGVVLAMTGHQKVILHGVMMALCVNIVLSWMLIPKWGLSGAAVAASAGLFAWNLYLAVKARKLTGLATTIFKR